jgi:hypothetical protein
MPKNTRKHKPKNNTRKKPRLYKTIDDCLNNEINSGDGNYFIGNWKDYEYLYNTELPVTPDPFTLKGLAQTVIQKIQTLVGSAPNEPKVCKTPICISDRSQVYRVRDNEKGISYIIKTSVNWPEVKHHDCITQLQGKNKIKIAPDLIAAKMSLKPPYVRAIIMEDLGGISLDDYLKNQMPEILSGELQEISNIIHKKVKLFHTWGYVHMDLKPQNFIVTMKPDNTLKDIFLIDFESAGKIGALYNSRPETPFYSYFYSELDSAINREANAHTSMNIQEKLQLKKELKENYRFVNSVETLMGKLRPEFNEYSLQKIREYKGLPSPAI